MDSSLAPVLPSGCPTPIGDGRPPRRPLRPYGEGPPSRLSNGPVVAFPLILTDGTFHDASTARSSLRRQVLAARPYWEARDSLGDFEKVLGCIEKAPARTARCRCCSGLRIVFQCKCSRRDCIIGKKGYPAKKAREYRKALGDLDWLAHFVVSLPFEDSQAVENGDSNRILKAVNKAIEGCFGGVEPAGVSALHWTGEKDPSRKHVHVHAIWSSKGCHAGKLVNLPGPYLSEEKLDELRAAASDALGVSVDRRQANYSYREEEVKVRHCIRYLTREQGCGDAISLVKFTFPRAHTLKPLGMLGRGKRTTWVGLVQHEQEEEMMPGGSHPIQLHKHEETGCHCRGKPSDVLHQLV